MADKPTTVNLLREDLAIACGIVKCLSNRPQFDECDWGELQRLITRFLSHVFDRERNNALFSRALNTWPELLRSAE